MSKLNYRHQFLLRTPDFSTIPPTYHQRWGKFVDPNKDEQNKMLYLLLLRGDGSIDMSEPVYKVFVPNDGSYKTYFHSEDEIIKFIIQEQETI